MQQQAAEQHYNKILWTLLCRGLLRGSDLSWGWGEMRSYMGWDR